MDGRTFYFKQFSIKQCQSAMKVGTDGVLIGAWTEIGTKKRRILDIGTGTGVIALMMAQRSADSSITAVEIEPKAAEEATFNVVSSPWKERINVVCCPIQEFSKKEQPKFDLIVSNPPYFNGSYKSEDIERMAARHTELLSGDDLLDSVTKLLDWENGTFSAIFPYDIGVVMVAKAAEKGLFCKRMCNVRPKEHSGIKRIMAEFTSVRTTPTTEELTIANDKNFFTKQYRTLTKDFYLKF